VSNGLLSNEFNGACFKNKRGEMYFGGDNGFVLFHPDGFQENKIPPPIVITNFRVFDEVRREFNIKQIDLKYEDNFFAFDFAALSYSMPEKNQYAYQLEGFDKEWIYSHERRYASYTNLDPGTYYFRVKGSNHDGIWNEQGTAIKVIIHPPWWRTIWAYTFYGLCFVCSVLGVDRFQRRRLIQKERERAREKELEQAREIEHAYHQLAHKSTELERGAPKHTGTLKNNPGTTSGARKSYTTK
jgi:hypothetical protein